MKKLKLTKCLFIILLTFTFLFTGMHVHAAKLTDNSPVSTLAYKTIWKYKIENGLLYRRLYNATTGEWIGDWELVP